MLRCPTRYETPGTGRSGWRSVRVLLNTKHPVLEEPGQSVPQVLVAKSTRPSCIFAYFCVNGRLLFVKPPTFATHVRTRSTSHRGSCWLAGAKRFIAGLRRPLEEEAEVLLPPPPPNYPEFTCSCVSIQNDKGVAQFFRSEKQNAVDVGKKPLTLTMHFSVCGGTDLKESTQKLPQKKKTMTGSKISPQ